MRPVTNIVMIDSLLALCLLDNTVTQASSPAEDIKIRSGSEVILVDEMTSRTRNFMRLDEGVLFVRKFEAGHGRYEEEQVPLQDLTELRVVERHRSAILPIAGGLLLGGLGVALGHSWEEELEVDDPGSNVAIGLGVVGFLVGAVTGAIISPESRSEKIVWSRD